MDHLENDSGDSHFSRRHATNGRVERTETSNALNEEKKEPQKGGAWPASFKRYLERAFDDCPKRQGTRQHGQLEKALDRIVTDTMADNRMLTTDWDNEPLPRYLTASDPEVYKIEFHTG